MLFFWHWYVKNTFASVKTKLLKIHTDIENRVLGFYNDSNKNNIKKVAFDTRRIDQEVEFNPRRGLQHYQRSEPFIDQGMSNKINLFFKVKVAADLIKEDFGSDPDWLDSKTRILCNAVNNVLRTEQKDYDFSNKQFNYFDELLYTRYRLKLDDIEKMSEMDIKNILLNKDEKLSHKYIYAKYDNFNKIEKHSNEPVKVIHNITQAPEDQLIKELFGNIKANKENKDISRSITITVNDKINEPIEKSSDSNNKIPEIIG